MKMSCEQFLRKDTIVYSHMSKESLMVGFINPFDRDEFLTNKKTLKVFDIQSLSKAKELVEHLQHYIKIAEEAGDKYKGQA